VEIDLGAIGSNIRWTLSRLKPEVRLMAVVKANGYGCGAVPVAKEAVKAGASSLGVLTVEEAQVLRKAGLRADIHLLSPVLPEQARQAVLLRLIPTLDDARQASAFESAAPRGFPVHIDVDFGLGRWGVLPRDLEGLAAGLRRRGKLKLAGLSTHIDYVPGKNAVEAEEKLRAFARLAQSLRRQHPGLICHAANSSVLMDFPHWQLDQVRVGNLLYGINAAKSKSAPLKNPWRFYCRITSLHRAIKGRSIGYASEYVAPRTMRVATLPAGYSDGLTMEPAERLIGLGGGAGYWGKIGRVKTPFVGRCGIAHVLVDVTDAPRAKLGDPVALPVRRTACNASIPRVYV
jgi:alanine racemase